MVFVPKLSALTPSILLLLSAVQGKPLMARRAEPTITSSDIEASVATATDSSGAAVSQATGEYPLCGGRYTGCVNNKPVKQKAPGGKRKLAYFPYYEGPSASETFNEQYLDGLTHLILFGVDARKLDAKGEIDYPEAYERDFPKDIVNKARAKGAAVMAAIGGWDIDTMFKEMATEADAQKMGSHIAKFAIANSLDGVSELHKPALHVTDSATCKIDIDHEYPTAQQAVFWPALLQQIKKEAPDLILSVAVPGEPHWVTNSTDTTLGKTKQELKEKTKRAYVYKAPVYQDAFEGWNAMIKKVEPMVDFINVMS